MLDLDYIGCPIEVLLEKLSENEKLAKRIL